MDYKGFGEWKHKSIPDIDMDMLMNSLEKVIADAKHCIEAIEIGREDDYLPTIMVAVVPGKPIQVIDVDECCDILPCFGESDRIMETPDELGLIMSCDERHLLTLGDERYLIGPAILYDVDADGEEASVSALEIYLTRQTVESRTVTLCADGKDFPAIRLD
ncbi:MAG: hypothetical protein LUH23_08245 [Oscillospiraceae bacterium]|nr:hypothetical protein [Oscillospiraceae bacterium]